MNKTASPRFLALDVFRGLTVCFMIIVNSAGNSATTFAPLLHAQWHGFTPTDLVFPSFLFAVGNSLAFVLPRWETMSNQLVLTKILKRTVIIFLLGYLMYWFPFVRYDGNSFSAFPFAETRVFGVLQRIALCYGIAAVLIWWLKPRTTYLLALLFLLLYWGILYWFGDPADPLSMQGNAGFYLDKWLVGEKHLYHGEGVAFDPEGLLSTLPAIANVVAGFWAGDLVRRKGSSWESVGLLLLAGVGALFFAYCWNGVFPVNKKLWTSSFVMLTVGLAAILLGGIIYLTDLRKKTGWTRFFIVFGKNPLFIYLLSELLVILLWFFRTPEGQPYYNHLYELVFSRFGGYLGSFLFAVSVMMVCWLAGWWMDRRKIYIRV